MTALLDRHDANAARLVTRIRIWQWSNITLSRGLELTVSPIWRCSYSAWSRIASRNV